MTQAVMNAPEKMSLGEYLRHEREARSITLRKISDETRIRTYYLELIENGVFSKLPAGPVGRGFVRSYASSIGVDPTWVVERFEAERPPRPEEESVQALQESAARLFPDASPRKAAVRLWLPVIAVLLFVIASGLGLWYLRGKTDRLLPVAGFAQRVKNAAVPSLGKLPGWWSGFASNYPSTAPLRLSPVSSSVSGEVASDAVSSEVIPSEAQRAERPRAPAAAELRTQVVKAVSQEERATDAVLGEGAENQDGGKIADEEKAPTPLSLSVYAVEDTWLRIAVDQHDVQELLLLAGNEKKWSGNERFTVTVGNVAGTQISLNGMNVTLPKNSSNVVRDFVISEKLLN